MMKNLESPLAMEASEACLVVDLIVCSELIHQVYCLFTSFTFLANEKGSAGVILTLTGVNEDMRQRLASKSRGGRLLSSPVGRRRADRRSSGLWFQRRAAVDVLSSFSANSTAVAAAVDVLPPLASTTAMACVDWQQRSMSSSGGRNIRSTSSKDLSGGGCWWFVKRVVLAASVVTKSVKGNLFPSLISHFSELMRCEYGTLLFFGIEFTGLLVVGTSRTTRMEFAKDLELQSMQLFMDTQVQRMVASLVVSAGESCSMDQIAHIDLKLPPRPPGYAFVEVKKYDSSRSRSRSLSWMGNLHLC
nr:hypothetical protein Iba_chr03dCG9240 [Ipomoea batatas]